MERFPVNSVHIHHQVFGIVVMMLSALILDAVQPSGSGLDIQSLALGVGVGLAVDGFAL